MNANTVGHIATFPSCASDEINEGCDGYEDGMEFLDDPDHHERLSLDEHGNELFDSDTEDETALDDWVMQFISDIAAMDFGGDDNNNEHVKADTDTDADVAPVNQ